MEYLTGRACPPSDLLYTPDRVTTKAGTRMVKPTSAGGGCSRFGDTTFYYDFRHACGGHDYGYDLVRLGALPNRDAVDAIFFDDMLAECANRNLLTRGWCRWMAAEAYLGVRLFGEGVDSEGYP
jgi:hypothetical protein